jgi:hypothetical protein
MQVSISSESTILPCVPEQRARLHVWVPVEYNQMHNFMNLYCSLIGFVLTTLKKISKFMTNLNVD